MNLERKLYATKKQVKTLTTEIITTQHCIKINEDWIELIYIFNESTLQVYVNEELVYSNRFNPSRIVLSYLNVLEVAVMIYERHKKTTVMPASRE
jgi:hypothetical protein